MYIVVLFALLNFHRAHLHLTYPINYCNMALTCIHDNRVVCASTVDGCSRRSFLDQCDMYEYNCDFGTRYQETYVLLCSELDTVTIQAPTIVVLSTKQIATKINTETALKATTLKATSVLESSTPVRNLPLSPSTTTTMRTTLVFKPDTESIYTNCCDRPKTWETTTEITNIFEILPNSLEIPTYNEIETDDADVMISEEITPVFPKHITSLMAKKSTPSVTTTSTKTTKTVPTTSLATSSFATTSATTTTVSTHHETSKTTVSSTTTPKPTKPTVKTSSKTTFVLTKPSTIKTSSKTSTTLNTFHPVTGSCNESQTSTSPASNSTKCCDRPVSWDTTVDENSIVTVEFPNKEKISTTLPKCDNHTETVTESTSRELHNEISISDELSSSSTVLHTSTFIEKISPEKPSTSTEKPIEFIRPTNIFTHRSIEDVTPSPKKETSATIDIKTRLIIHTNVIHNSKKAITATPRKRSTMSLHSKSRMESVRTTIKKRDLTSNSLQPETKTEHQLSTPRKMKMTMRISTHTFPNAIPTTARWWYPAPCRSSRCQRPITWDTTVHRQRYRHGHH